MVLFASGFPQTRHPVFGAHLLPQPSTAFVKLLVFKRGLGEDERLRESLSISPGRMLGVRELSPLIFTEAQRGRKPRPRSHRQFWNWIPDLSTPFYTLSDTSILESQGLVLSDPSNLSLALPALGDT